MQALNQAFGAGETTAVALSRRVAWLQCWGAYLPCQAAANDANAMIVDVRRANGSGKDAVAGAGGVVPVVAGMRRRRNGGAGEGQRGAGNRA